MPSRTRTFSAYGDQSKWWSTRSVIEAPRLPRCPDYKDSPQKKTVMLVYFGGQALLYSRRQHRGFPSMDAATIERFVHRFLDGMDQ